MRKKIRKKNQKNLVKPLNNKFKKLQKKHSKFSIAAELFELIFLLIKNKIKFILTNLTQFQVHLRSIFLKIKATRLKNL